MMIEPHEGQAVISVMQQLGDAWIQRQRQSLDMLRAYNNRLIVVIQLLEAKTRGKPDIRTAYKLYAASLYNVCDLLSETSLASPAANFLKQVEQPRTEPDEPKELLEDYQRKLRRDENEILLRLIELLDASERIQQRREKHHFQDTPVPSIWRSMQSLLREFENNLRQHLSDVYGVEPLMDDDLIGQYPPFETTRIAYREDTNTSSDIIVARILEHGYLRDDRLLRKTVVTVKTQQRS